jgi:hypothetical protein
MKRSLILAVTIALASSGCVAGPGGTNNAANRAVGGGAIGALLGGVAGAAAGDAAGGAALGAIAGAGIGAAVNPNRVDNDTRGYCYTVDSQGQPITIVANEVDCRAANGTPAPR